MVLHSLTKKPRDGEFFTTPSRLGTLASRHNTRLLQPLHICEMRQIAPKQTTLNPGFKTNASEKIIASPAAGLASLPPKNSAAATTGGPAPVKCHTSVRIDRACEPCRKRKLKCDGTRPSCDRCSRRLRACHYSASNGSRKRRYGDLTSTQGFPLGYIVSTCASTKLTCRAARKRETLTSASKRLARYERLLNKIVGMVNPQIRERIEAARTKRYQHLCG